MKRRATPPASWKLFIALGALLALALLVGCESDDGGGGGSTGDGDADVVAEVGVDTGAGDVLGEGDAETTPDSAEEVQTVDWGDFDSCTYTGTVVDAAGAPIEGLPVVICSEASPFCGSGKTKADGTWQVAGLDRIPLGAKVLGALANKSSVTIPLETCSQPSTDIGATVLVDLSDGELIAADTGGSAQAHPELRLELPAGLSFPNYETETKVRAARLDPADIHPFILAEISPRAVFAIAPYGTESPADVPFEATIAELSGAVAVYALDHLTGHPHKVCDAEVVDGAVSCGEVGLPELTWILFE